MIRIKSIYSIGAIAGCLFMLGCPSSDAQSIIGVGTRYADSFRQWIITTDDEDINGELRLRWEFRDEWTEWDVQYGDITATIDQKWRDDPNLWEIRCEGIVVNAKTVWPNEFNRWKLSDGNHQFTWGTRYYNRRDEWSTGTKGRDYFQVYTYWEGDPREWVVIDELPDYVSNAMKIAMIFLAIHCSSPRM